MSCLWLRQKCEIIPRKFHLLNIRGTKYNDDNTLTEQELTLNHIQIELLYKIAQSGRTAVGPTATPILQSDFRSQWPEPFVKCHHDFDRSAFLKWLIVLK